MIIMDNKSLLLKVVESRSQQKETQVVVQVVKNLPAMQKTRGRFLGREDPLEKEMTTCSITLAWEILWREEPGGLQSMGRKSV